jgi:hypothetical protein
MTETALKAALEEVVPPFVQAPRQWDDVLVRARIRRERRDWRRASIVAVALIVIAVPSLAIGATALFREFPRPDDVRDEPVRIGPREEIATGQAGDVHWRLVAFRSDRGLCVGLDFGGALQASSASCGARRPAAVSAPTVDYIGRGANRTWFYGTAAKRAANVILVLRNGARIAAPIYPSPQSLALPFDFYVATVPGAVASAAGGSPVRLVIALDEAGRAIGRATS